MPNTTTETPGWLREMETILEELNEGVVVVDDQLRVIFANEALRRMGHFERNEIQGCTPDEIFPSEDLPSIKRQHESGHRSGRHRSEFYLPRKDGTQIPAIFSGRVTQGPDKQEYVLLIGRIGWHTFRHTFRTLLDETGAPMKVQQELMRHADIRTTMNVYGKAMDESKREAHGKVVRLVLPSKVA